MNLTQLGWNNSLVIPQYAKESYILGRISAQYRNAYSVYSEFGVLNATLSGKLYYSLEKHLLPVVGDWVVMDSPKEQDTIIYDVVARKSKFSRKAAGSRLEEQVIAANLDKVFVVMGLDQDLNLRRLERFIVLIWESGCEAVVVLSKADLCEDIDAVKEQVLATSPGISIVATSTHLGTGLDELKTYIAEGVTIAFVGSSGVGKSSLVNALLNENVQKVQEVRSFKDRGKHTTTNREMFLLPDGGLLVDTPGMREVQLWTSEETVGQSFRDIENLMENCYYSNCSHTNEPDCAILGAIEEGTLERKRYLNYCKMLREVSHFTRDADPKELQRKKQERKRLAKEIRKKTKYKNMI